LNCEKRRLIEEGKYLSLAVFRQWAQENANLIGINGIVEIMLARENNAKLFASFIASNSPMNGKTNPAKPRSRMQPAFDYLKRFL
jgi:hypothetical protein